MGSNLEFQRNRMLKDVDSAHLLKKAAEILEFDIAASRDRSKATSGEKEKRDMLIYLLWKTGRLTNQRIGNLMGLTYSAVSKVVGALAAEMQLNIDLRAKMDLLNSQFKV